MTDHPMASIPLADPLPTDDLLSNEQIARAVALAIAKPVLAAKPFGSTNADDLIRLAEWILTGGPRQREYPFTEGNVQVLGPSVIASDNGAVINWLGVNYIPDEEGDEPDWERVEDDSGE